MFPYVERGEVAKCAKCVQTMAEAADTKPQKLQKNGRQAHNFEDDDDDDDDGEFDIPEPGIMKPDITFFGEQLPNTFFDRLTEQDRDLVDLVIVIGTSMKVAPVSEIPNYIPGNVPQIYISREPANHINFDISLLGFCDDVVSELCRRANFVLDHEMARTDTVAHVETYGDTEHQWTITTPGAKHTKEEVSDSLM